jgi:hypothetical protein
MESLPLKFWKAAPALTGGAFVGLITLIALRVEYYAFMQYQPNMAPQIAYYFSPVLLAGIMVVALPIEVLFRRFLCPPYSQMQAFLAGAAYSSLLVWWAFPGHWVIFMAINPIVLRWLLGIAFRSTRTRAKKARAG